jgi:hypothetical protein
VLLLTLHTCTYLVFAWTKKTVEINNNLITYIPVGSAQLTSTSSQIKFIHTYIYIHIIHIMYKRGWPVRTHRDWHQTCWITHSDLCVYTFLSSDWRNARELFAHFRIMPLEKESLNQPRAWWHWKGSQHHILTVRPHPLKHFKKNHTPTELWKPNFASSVHSGVAPFKKSLKSTIMSPLLTWREFLHARSHH